MSWKFFSSSGAEKTTPGPISEVVAEVAGVSTYTFSGLDGNVDQGYELRILGPWVLGSGGNLRIRPNNVATTTYHQTYHHLQNGATHVVGDQGNVTGYDLTTAYGAETHVLAGLFTLMAKTTTGSTYGRTGHGEIAASQKTSGNRCITSTTTTWSNITDNITSLVVDFGGGTFTGTLSLRKLKPSQTFYSQAPVTADPWHVVGAAGEPAFTNSWVNFDAASMHSASFRKDSMGRVHLRGQVKSGTAGTSVFTLPVGYRPALRIDPAFGGASPAITGAIMTNGDVIGASGNTRLGFDGISFDV